MKRRNMLLGTGAVLAGSGAVIGTGAFSAAQLRNRDADISVVNDAQGLIGLVPNDEISGVELSGGELTIGLEDNGINVNSVYQFGYFSEEWEAYDPAGDDFPFTTTDPSANEDGNFRSAFLVRNQSDTKTDVELSFSVDESESTPGNTKFLFETHYMSDEEMNTDTIVYDSESDPEMTMSVDSLGPGEDFGVSFIVDATDGEVGDDFTAGLSVLAGEAVGSQ